MADNLPRANWITADCDDAAAALVARELGLAHPVARVLVSRGYGDPHAAELFLNPRLSDLSDPLLIPGMQTAVGRILRALDKSEQIAVYGDYDADGVTGAAMLVLVIEALGGRARAFLPDRLRDGYGFNVAPLQRCLARIEPSLIITVDCGTGAREAVEEAGRAGVDVIVTDHHEPAELAPAIAVVNARLAERESIRQIAGVGVAFKLCHALVRECMKRGMPCARDLDLREFLDLAAVGTVADVAPLTGENRTFVRHGLALMNDRPRPGLRALRDSAGAPERLNAYHLGFVIGPRLNAAGRIEDAELALELLLTQNARRARELAARLESLNRERKRIEDAILAEAREEIDARRETSFAGGIVVGRTGWHSGTIGIVASRLCGIYGAPAAVVAFDADGVGRGSCRSIEMVDILEVLRECTTALCGFGGHAMAAGFSLELRRLDDFKERFDAACRSRMEGKDLRPRQTVDAWITLGEADDDLLASVERLQPLGHGNPTPVWGLRAARAAAPPRAVGRKLDHLKLVLACGGSEIEAIAFNMANARLPDGEMDVAAQLQENNYLGRRRLQLNIKDLRPSQK